MGGRQPPRGENGQGTVEWIGLVLLVALLVFGLLATVGPRLPGGSLARAIAERIICAVHLSDACAGDPALERAYGAEVGALVRDHAPRIRYERGMEALPVDYRSCREDACSRGARTGEIWRSTTGEPVVAFVHVVDCRPVAIRRSRRAGANCSGPRNGNLYLQYWFNCERRDGALRPVAALCVRAGETSAGPILRDALYRLFVRRWVAVWVALRHAGVLVPVHRIRHFGGVSMRG